MVSKSELKPPLWGSLELRFLGEPWEEPVEVVPFVYEPHLLRGLAQLAEGCWESCVWAPAFLSPVTLGCYSFWLKWSFEITAHILAFHSKPMNAVPLFCFLLWAVSLGKPPKTASFHFTLLVHWHSAGQFSVCCYWPLMVVKESLCHDHAEGKLA